MVSVALRARGGRSPVPRRQPLCRSGELPGSQPLLAGRGGQANRQKQTAGWCHETCYAVTKDGNESSFFWAWDRAVDFMHRQGMYSGEGGVMGLAAAYAGWKINYELLAHLGSLIHHEGGGPKEE